MQATKVISLLLLVGLCGKTVFSQSMSTFRSLGYPRSIMAAGMGEQGVASRSASTAMQYNPANLAFANGLGVSLFRNPWQILGWDLPFASLTATATIENAGSFGLEYTYWNLGEFSVSTTNNPDGGESYHFYERTVAAGYAWSVTDRLALGAHMRYVWLPVPRSKNADQVLFSAGLSYRPEVFSDRVNFGISLMNFGGTIDYHSQSSNGTEIVQSDPPPANIQIGIEGAAVANSLFDLNLALSVSKPFDKDPPDYEAQSSFKSFFKDWSDFPKDVTTHSGLGFLWHAIPLGGGVSFLQEMYLGSFVTGPKDVPNSFLTHGFTIGVEANGVRGTVGYAGRWHNNRTYSYLRWDFPWETFQLSVSTDLTVFGKEKDETASENILHGIILSAGYSYGQAVGKMKESAIQGGTASYSSPAVWSVEADFCINERSALLSSLSYSRMMRKWTNLFSSSQFAWEIGMETFSIESGYRYHPIEDLHPFFVQASLGVIRINPVLEEKSFRYFYETFDRLVVGCVVPVTDLGFVVIPKIGLRTVFMNEFTNVDELGGHNQFEFGVNLGYQL